MGQYPHLIEFYSPHGQEVQKESQKNFVQKSSNLGLTNCVVGESEKCKGILDLKDPHEKVGNSSGFSQSNSFHGQSEKFQDTEETLSVAEPPVKRVKRNIVGTWESVDGGKLLVYTTKGLKSSSLVAAYDLDGTLICTSSGRTFPKNKDDWKVLYPEIVAKLKEEVEKSYKILIFTNQAGITTGKNNVNDFKSKIEDVISALNITAQVFVATGYSIYRKPAVGMWEAAMERNSNINVDKIYSFYCGDAAGRKGNHSQVDLLFSKNLELKFETPEYHFLNKKMPSLNVTVFDPKTIPCDVPLCEPSWGQVISNKLEVIILVGFPGAGKTHFVKTHLIPAGYVHINRDFLGTWAKCANAMTTALKNKQKVVVDNTNPDVKSRKKYIDLAKTFTSTVRCFIMKTTMDHAKHNNKVSNVFLLLDYNYEV